MVNNKHDKINDMSENTVTRAYLDRALSKYATKKDLDVMGIDFGEQLADVMMHFDFRFNRVEQRLDEHYTQFKKLDLILRKLDHMESRFDKYDQEQAFIGHQLRRVQDKIEKE